METPEADYEPGAPSARAMAPSVIFGAVVPLTVYYLIRHHVSGDATALAIAGAFPAGYVVVEWIRTRHLDPIASITLFGFLAGLGMSVALGGNAFVLKVRDSVFTALFGIVCLLSLRFGQRPMMFHIGKALSAGEDENRRAAYDELYEHPSAPRVFARITIAWGIGLIFDAVGRVFFALVLPTGLFLAAAPALAAVVFGGLFVFTVRYSNAARARAEAEDALLAERGDAYPSAPVVIEEAPATP